MMLKFKFTLVITILICNLIVVWFRKLSFSIKARLFGQCFMLLDELDLFRSGLLALLNSI